MGSNYCYAYGSNSYEWVFQSGFVRILTLHKQKKKSKKEESINSVIEIAKKHQRNYITPEDVSEALKLSRFSSWKVRLEVLEVLAKQTEYGAEDPSLCAFVAWKGRKK